ncbi:MAG: DUF2721 domain-containing protein [Gammaproteobacteria bacterium]|nr:DUF2721 domain-containing protein [Gammaproteobacteria bacterium]
MDTLQWNIGTIAHVIDISVAPVFLLAGISGLLMVLTNRLARTIDRSRSLQAAGNRRLLPEHQSMVDREMAYLLQRSRCINLSINFATMSALLVCFVIITLFLGNLISANVSFVVASLFIVCMVVLVAAFSCFLAEVFIASRSLRITLVNTDSFGSSE